MSNFLAPTANVSPGATLVPPVAGSRRRPHRLRAGLTAVAVAAAGMAVPLAIPAAADASIAEQRAVAADAATWLAGEVVDGAMPGFVGPDWGLTIDTLLALQAAGVDSATARTVTTTLAANVRAYNSWDDWGIPDIRVAGATAKLLVAAVSVGAEPTDFGGFDLRAELLDLVADAESGSQQGRVRDRVPPEYGGDSSNTFDQSLAVVGLVRSGGVPQTVVDFLIRQQCTSGGFRLSPDVAGKASPSCDEQRPEALLDTDATALAVQALLVAAESGADGAAAAAARGAQWLVAAQLSDGSFGGSGPTAGANTNSTGLAGQALAAAGHADAADRAARYVIAHQLTAANAGAAAGDAGAIAYNDASFSAARNGGIPDLGRDQWRRATAQALLGLASVPFGAIGEIVPPGPIPSGSASASATPSASVSATPSTSGSPSGSPSPSRSTDATVTATWSPPPAGHGGGLPITGSAVRTLLLLAFGALIAGVIALLLARSRRVS